MDGVGVFGVFCLALILLCHYDEVDRASYDILGFYPSSPRTNPFWYSMSQEEQVQWRSNQQKKIAEAYAAVWPQVFWKMLPCYILWLLAVGGIIGGRFWLNHKAEKQFEANPLYYCTMRVVGKEIYHSRYSTRTRLMLKDREGKILQDVSTDCPYEIEPDTEVLLITTPNSYKGYEAVYPADILRGTGGFSLYLTR